MSKGQIAFLALCAALGSFAGVKMGVHDRQAVSQSEAFDYEGCRSIVAKGSLSNPGVPDDWKEIETTPGGNWCVR
jgi:hypothetical protein